MRKPGFLALLMCSFAQAQTVSVTVDVTSNVHPVSPLIFGVALREDYALSQSSCNLQAGYTACRWGGNSTTRYNWQTDFANHAVDWYYENIPNDPVTCAGSPPANSSDAFVYCSRGAGAQPLLTIPTIGFTPRADSPATHPFFAGFSVNKYGIQEPPNAWSSAVDPSDTDAGSGECLPAHNPSANCVYYFTDYLNVDHYHLINNDPADTSTSITSAFESAWIGHLQATFGGADSGGVKFYALDNEVMLWDSTHRDVHPNPPTYDEIWSRTADYAAAIKTQDAAALVTGPVTWGYPDLFTSAKDAADCNCSDGSDRQNHADLAFVAWYLQQVCANPLAGGKRLVDYLDLHYYPQGNNVALSDADDAITAGLRLRSLKELYDPTWVSESWIADLGDFDSNHYDKPGLIPRVRSWINTYCPGTKLAITEYNWGNDGTASGAVAQAEVLAIFAREGVDLATRWVAPDVGSLAERAFRIFLNYDGAGSKVQGDSVFASSSNVDQVGAYAFRNYGRHTMVLLTNKDPTNPHDVTVTFSFVPEAAGWQLYGFDSANDLHPLSNVVSAIGPSLTLNALPPMSANLLVVPDNDGIFKDGFE